MRAELINEDGTIPTGEKSPKTGKPNIRYSISRNSGVKRLYVDNKLVFEKSPIVGDLELLRLMHVLGVIEFQEVIAQ
jgi:hypothetical protein